MGDIEKSLKWMYDHHRKNCTARYSMTTRYGNPNYDCSSAVYYALIAGGFLKKGAFIGNTETLYKEKCLKEITYDQVRRGDIFIQGVQGKTLGAGGHTGFFTRKGEIIHCNYTNDGISTNNESEGYWYFLDSSYRPIRYFRPISLDSGADNIDDKNYKASAIKNGYKLFGIDASNHQKGLDFSKNKVKLDFIVLKASEGSTFKDSWFDDMYKDCKAKGIRVGAYHFLQAQSADEAIVEAKFFLNTIKNYECDFGYWCDVEDKTFLKDKETATKIVDTFCSYIQNQNHYIGIYASEFWGFQEHLNHEKLSKYAFWVANWKNKPNLNHFMWQYSDKENIPGFNVAGSSVCDANYAKSDISSYIKSKGMCGYKLTKSDDSKVTDDVVEYEDVDVIIKRRKK